jgi:hypothetical protein
LRLQSSVGCGVVVNVQAHRLLSLSWGERGPG